MWSESFMERDWIKGYNTLLMGDNKTSEYDTYKTTYSGVTTALKLINKTAYNEVIIVPEDTVYFQIAKEAKTKDNKYRNKIQVWIKIPKKMSQPQGLPRQDYARIF